MTAEARRFYLDWNASAPLDPAARAAMAAAMDQFGNPSSQHREGRAARALVERAREQVAALVGAAPGEVAFTSGATEAANWALKGKPWAYLRVSGAEHAAVAAAAEAAGAALETIGVSESGALDPADLARPALAAGEGLVIVGAANGETGAVEPPGQAAEAAARLGARLFTDATQLAGKAAAAAGEEALFSYAFDGDYAAISAHKFGGPKGVGALLIREGLALAPLLHGGGQELRRRSGTENLIGVAGMGAAAEAAAARLADGESWGRVKALRDRLEARLRAATPELTVIAGAAAHRLVNTLTIAAPGLRAETALIRLDLAGIAVSAGSACASGKLSASPTLAAMGLAPEIARGALRISLGPETAPEAIEAFLAAWARL